MIRHRHSNIFRELWMLTKFSTVGLIATAVHALILVILIQGDDISPVLATAAAFMVAFVFSFFGHHFWTFNSRTKRKNAVWKFLAVQSTAFAANNVVLITLLNMHILPQIVVALASLFVMPLLTYFLNRMWVFREEKAEY